jgi:galactofuranosylgalactofuranosylrhamnosyl-N-acetylglucosaminyl-diphospho-decaprenol beta-1,5/1,6-galactofuranosyltransferase
MTASAEFELQRVIFPPPGELDAIELYVDAGSAVGLHLVEDDGLYRSPKLPEDKLHLVGATAMEAHHEDFLSRTSMTVRAGQHVSFGTYFNAFPASYWRRWTTVRSVRLAVSTEGTGSVVVYKSNARGVPQRLESIGVQGMDEVRLDLPLETFGDGGWYWFELVAGKSELKLLGAAWATSDSPTIPAGEVATVQITTMNKPAFCIANARILGSNPHALKSVKEVLIIDQGTDKVTAADDFDEVSRLLDGKLRVVEQANLGGSGGFSRGMAESVRNGSEFVLLLDDDVVVEPDSIERLIAFARFSRKPTIVGGHMFDLYSRTTLHTFGEVVDPYRLSWISPDNDIEYRHDFRQRNLRQTPWMHRRVDVDFNGWWMCLIPTAIIREIGLSLPVFIKWDDAEYSLRAKEAGYSTVSLPGAALWHVSWIDKDDSLGWQSYFHERNRLIAALIHSPFPKGGRVLRESFQNNVKHLISMQYFAQEARIMALRDVLRGPAGLHADLGTKLAEVNALRSRHPEAQIRSDIDDFPAPGLTRGGRGGALNEMPAKKDLVKWAAKTVLRQVFRKPDPQTLERPQAHLAHRENKWWTLSKYDSVLVSNAEGTGISWYRRDPGLLKSKLMEASKLQAQLFQQWESLSAEYRKALPEVTSMESWEKTFGTTVGTPMKDRR